MDETDNSTAQAVREGSDAGPKGAFARLLGDAWVQTAPGIFHPAGGSEPSERGRPLRIVTQPHGA
ncbi:MAG TPA: hypothetical protein VFA19_04700 [Gaiellaceae bacterium]|nr:hypothetical protein [Gaiellaceae bacterium]